MLTTVTTGQGIQWNLHCLGVDLVCGLAEGFVHGRSSQPVSVRLPSEYSKVVEQLGQAREKQLQGQALNELGDVQAHLGALPLALQAWHGAVDLIVGPYQVCKVSACFGVTVLSAREDPDILT